MTGQISQDVTETVSQMVVAETISDLVPLIEQATAEFVPTAEDAAEAVTAGRACWTAASIYASYASYAE